MNYLCIISGRVQAVCYRSNIQAMASAAGFNGYVRNLSDGNVEACVTINDEKTLAYFVEILKQGSPYSRVADIKIESIKTTFKDGFTILR